MPRPPLLKPLVAAVPLALVLLGGCASYFQSSDSVLGIITPYRIEIVQGNVVTKEQMAHVKPGMTRQQVRDALGSPLLTDIFHADRWDYVFTIRRQGTEPQRRHIMLVFESDALKSVDAPDLPSEKEFVASITSARNQPHGSPKVLELSEEQRKALPTPPAPPQEAASAPADATPSRDYPPLEPQR
ncbi:MAG TPA: outer membrane protein assembly factor BamE [Burkholderiaceae bacterium]|nr:outer membrane protein assembly factor BamE [Burkholderiaceae bacterium]